MSKIKHLKEDHVLFTDGGNTVRSISYESLLNKHYLRYTTNPFIVAEYDMVREELRKMRPELFL